MNEPFAFYEESAEYVRARMPFRPEIAVILGSSLGPFAAEVQCRTEIAYADIPNFPRCTVADHAGQLIFVENWRTKNSSASQAGSTATRATTSSS